MFHGMKETCTEATREDATGQFCLWEPCTRFQTQCRKIWKTPKFDLITQTYPCIEMLDERKEQCHFTRGCLLISMTFYEFSKTWSQFPWLFQAWKNGIPWLFQVFHDWIHPGLSSIFEILGLYHSGEAKMSFIGVLFNSFFHDVKASFQNSFVFCF